MERFFPAAVLTASIILVAFTTGCSQLPVEQSPHAGTTDIYGIDPKRLQVICESQGGKYTGGMSIIRDNNTGREFLVIVGRNGAPSVTPLTPEQNSAVPEKSQSSSSQ